MTLVVVMVAIAGGKRGLPLLVRPWSLAAAPIPFTMLRIALPQMVFE